MSPTIINKMISSMGQTLLRTRFNNMKKVTPSWFSIISHEANDVANQEPILIRLLKTLFHKS